MSACILCKSSEINNLELGEMKVLGDLQVHYFCMLLSSGLLTNGEEDEGILGFLPSDIKKESRRAIRLKCHYCHQTGASIGCCIPACNRSFHLNCGLKNNCLNQFTSEFKSFCHRHVEDSEEKFSKDHVCIICYAEMGKYDKIESVFAPCCKSEWFHKICLKKLADSAGYFFKCPKCNDVEKFSDECMKRGIFIPQRDAAWETEENAFHELMERPNKCNAINCNCADGRESDKPSNELIICETCGSNCIHKNCWQLNEPYYCCIRIDLKNDSNCNPEPTNNESNTSRNAEDIGEMQKKRKREHQTDDEKLDEKRQKKRKTDKWQARPSRHKAKDTLNHRSKVNFKHNDIIINSKFPITKIRNGTFDQILRHTPRVLLYPVSLENFDNLAKKIVEPSNSKRSLITSNFDNNFKNRDSTKFAVISPTKKASGKSFKNYMITSFFKPFN